MYATRTEAAEAIGRSADRIGHLVREGEIPDARRPDAPGMAGDGRPREALVFGSGLPVEADWRGDPVARIGQTDIELEVE